MLSVKEGIKVIKVNLDLKEGHIQFLPHIVNPLEIVKQIEDMGFDAEIKSINGRPFNQGTRF